MNDLRNDAVTVESACPSAQVLASFSSGRVPEEALATIADHVSHCETCAETVRRLTSASDSLASRLRDAVRHFVPLDEPGCLRLQALAKAIPHARLDSCATKTQFDGDSAVQLQAGGAGSAVNSKAATEYWPTVMPQSVGRYRVQSELGYGAFGSVYLAHDPDLDRLVAIKVPKFTASVTDPMIRWFVGEARTAAKLKHPGIVGIYEVGREPDGSCFIVMEYVEGRSLAATIAGGNLPVDQGVQIVAQAAAAAHYAHKKGLVHRDLKPGNLLLDGDGQVKIADFGLALHDDQQRSRAGERAGTPAYMSPEQIRGDAHRLDGRSDVWALGVILYEILAGKRPFGGNSEQTADEILTRSPKPLRQFRDDLDPALESICLKCLAKNPEQRFATCQDLAAALRAWQTGAQQAAPRRSRRAVWAMVLLGLAGCTAAAAVAIPYLRRDHNLPFLVDNVARPHLPLNLLDRPPERLFPEDAPNEPCEYVPETQQINLGSETTILLSLGFTRSEHYRLHVEATKIAPDGSFALFFGFHEAASEFGRKRWKGQMLTVQYYSGGEASVIRHELTVWESRTGSLYVQRIGLHDRRFDDIGLDAVPLDVEVNHGRVVSVKFGGRPFPFNDPAIGAVDLPTAGRFGVSSWYGSTTFKNARFESLKTAAGR